MKRFPLWAIVIVGVLLLCSVCVSASAMGALVWNLWHQTADRASVEAPTPGTTRVAPTSPPTLETREIPASENPTPSSTPGTTQISPRLLKRMKEIEEEVAEIRGLAPKRPVEREFLTEEELRKIVEEDFFGEMTPEDARDDALELWVLGLLNRDFDLYNFYIDLYTDAIAGFYDDEEEKMYVVTEQGFPPHARLTYAHEFTHALQDQYWDLDQGLQLNDDHCEKDTEYCAGVRALVEGDASFVELTWFWTKATPQEQRAIRRYYENLENPVFDNAPAFFQEDLLFPYEEGQDFVQYLYNLNGWDTVNQAYENPPVSTEQILHPERYPEDKPIRVQLPDLPALLGEGWKPVVEYNALGEYWIYLLLRYGRKEDWQLRRSTAQEAAEGWGGDAYALYYHPETDEIVFVMDIRWDTPQDGNEFRDAFLAYAKARFGAPRRLEQDWLQWTSTPQGTVLFWSSPHRSLWIMAPDALIPQLRDVMYGTH